MIPANLPFILNQQGYSKHHFLILCEEGEMKGIYDSLDICIRKNDFYVGIEGHLIGLQEYSEDFKAWFVFIHPKFGHMLRQKNYLPIFLRLIKNPIIQLKDAERVLLDEYFQVIKSLIDLKYNTERRQIVIHLFQALFHIVSQFEGFNLDNIQKKMREQQLFESFLELFHKNFHQSHEIGWYADKLCISPNYLSKICLHITDKSAKKWMSEILMEQACMMLRNLDGLSIKEISEALGFPNQSVFGKYFKKHTGQTPREYREA